MNLLSRHLEDGGCGEIGMDNVVDNKLAMPADRCWLTDADCQNAG